MDGKLLYELLRKHFPQWLKCTWEILNPEAKGLFEKSSSDLVEVLSVDAYNLALGRAKRDLNAAVFELEDYKNNRKAEYEKFERDIQELRAENDRLIRRLGLTEPEPVVVVPVNRLGEIKSLWVLRKTSQFRPLSNFEIFASESEEFEMYSLEDPELFMLRHTPFSLMEKQSSGDGVASIIVNRAREKRLRAE